MPIVLSDRRTPQTLTFGDSAITLYPAAGDLVLASIRRGVRDATGSIDSAERASVEAAIRIVSGCVTDWRNVLGADGAPIPWPDAGRAESVPGVESPSPNALAARAALLRALPWNILAALDRASAVAWSEAEASGKDSGTG